MVKEEKRNNQSVYLCEECNFLYKDRQWAEKCETWCKKHQSCSLEIIKHSFEYFKEGG